jgi:hypothetical protein
MYIGDVWIPYVSEFSIDKGNRNVELVRHISPNTPIHYAEFPNPELTMDIRGTVVQSSSSPKTAEQYAEDIINLLDSYAPYNYINDFQGRSGWLSISNAECPAMANRPLSRNYSISGHFMPKTLYEMRYRTYPLIRTNSYGITFADCYVPIPIGATYRGGDGKTITRTGVDGTQTLVLATTNNNIYWNLDDDDFNVGECKCYDTMTSGDDTETNWIRVYDINHAFTGDCVIENNTTRCIFTLGGGAITPKIYSYVVDTWKEMTQHSFTDYISNASTLTNTSPNLFIIDSLNLDNIVVRLQYDHINTSKASWNLYYSISQGDVSVLTYCDCTSSIPKFRHTCETTDDFEPRFICSNNAELHDALLETDGAHGTIDTSDNWHVMIDTTLNQMFIATLNSNIGDEYAYLNATDDVVTNMYIHDITTTSYRLNMGGFPIKTSSLFKECESMTKYGSPADYTGTDASPTTGTTGVSFTSDSHSIIASYQEGVDFDGDATYTLFIRAKDSIQVNTDLECTIANTDDTTIVKYDNFTLTSDWAYYTTDFTLDSADAGDNITIEFEKRTATANQIDLDYILILPKYNDNATYPRDIGHQALVNKRGHRELVSR